jgi:hypothetical protein
MLLPLQSYCSPKYIYMKRIILPIAVLLLFSCKKNTSDTGTQGTGATVTFTNNELYAQRLILTGSGAADTLFPLPNRVLDIDVAAKTSVTRTDIPAGSRLLFGSVNCSAGQPLTGCTSYVTRRVVYQVGSTYTEILKP